MRAGNLYNRVWFYPRKEITDGYGTTNHVWVTPTIKTRGEVRYLSSNRQVTLDEATLSSSVEVTVRYRDDIKDTMRLRIDGKADIWVITYMEVIGRYEALRLGVEKIPELWDVRFDSAFLLTIDTRIEATGDGKKKFSLPVGGIDPYDGLVNWGDGSVQELTGVQSIPMEHTYSAEGIYQVGIIGDIPKLAFNGTSNGKKVLSIDQWGGIKIYTGENMFAGCSNMIGRYTDKPDVSSVSLATSMFWNCAKFNSSIDWNWKDNLGLSFFMMGCTEFNQPIPAFKPINFGSAFANCISLKQSFAKVDVTAVQIASGALQGTDIGTNNYDATLIAWAAQNAKSNITISFGIAKRSAASQDAYDFLTITKGWTITDGGMV